MCLHIGSFEMKAGLLVHTCHRSLPKTGAGGLLQPGPRSKLRPARATETLSQKNNPAKLQHLFERNISTKN